MLLLVVERGEQEDSSEDHKKEERTNERKKGALPASLAASLLFIASEMMPSSSLFLTRTILTGRSCFTLPKVPVTFAVAALLSFLPSTWCLSTSNTMKTRNNPLPNLPLPPAICSDVPGTWAYDTMSRRVNEEILQRTAEDCAEDLAKPAFANIRASINELRNELENAATTQLSYLDTPAEDTPERAKELHEWNVMILKEYIENESTWLTAP